MTRLTMCGAATLFAIGSPVAAETPPPGTDAPSTVAAEQFALISSWEGRWEVAETPSLRIVFEKTARASVIVERWETATGLHSMTVYHRDGDTVMATHYCPQGNQPRLQSTAIGGGTVRFEFRDVTDLDSGESHTHSLWFTPQSDGTLLRSEIYSGADGAGEPSSYTLRRSE